jgi:hypothetical protein
MGSNAPSPRLKCKSTGKLKELQDVFMQVASVNHVLPLDDRSVERLNPAIAGRPDLMAGRKSLSVYQGMTGLSENAFINIKNQSHNITADVVIPKDGADGVLLAQGGRFCGWSLYVKGGKPVYAYNWLGQKRYSVASQQKLAPGKNTIRFEFAYDGGGSGKGGLGTLLVNGKKVAQARIKQTECCTFSIDEGADVGCNNGTPVTEDYKVPFAFKAVIDKVTIDLPEKAETERAVSEPVRQENKGKRVLSD